MRKNWVLLSYFIVLLTACDSSLNSRLGEYIYRVKNQSMQQPESDPKFVSLAKFSYSDEANRSNPFQMKFTENKLATSKAGNNETLGETPLESLKFVGTLKKGSEIWALISRPDGKLFSIKVGDTLGAKEERVIAIKENLLQLEKRTVFAGKWQKEVKEIYL